MIVSNEPGYYASGVFGIRIENLLIVVERAGLGGVGGQDPRQRKFLGFERLTYIPISKRLIKQDLLSPEEVKWVDRYHAEVWERISPLLTSSEAEAWLREATAPMVC
jgi:Xaa-Pro aminopeptidase